MRFTTSVVASMLASAAVARPRPMDEGEPLEHKSRITAFVVDEQGYPSIECWEISTLSDYQAVSTHRADGSKATGYVMPIASGRDQLEGVDILTWPEPSPIWPPPAGQVDTYGFFQSLINLQSGLIKVAVAALNGAGVDTAAAAETHIFSLENGDDWFYFEDSYSGSDLARSKNAVAPPVTISTVSGGDTELLRLNYNGRPKHTVVHKGACKFTGIVTPSSVGYDAKTSPARAPLSVQVNIEEHGL